MKTLPDKLLTKMDPAQRAKLGPGFVTAKEAQTKCADRTEAAMQATIHQYCDLHGWPCYRSRTDKRTTGRVGTPDLLICLPAPVTTLQAIIGIFIGIECKMKGNKTTAEQEHELARINHAHGFTLVAYSAQSAIDWLKNIAGKKP